MGVPDFHRNLVFRVFRSLLKECGNLAIAGCRFPVDREDKVAGNQPHLFSRTIWGNRVKMAHCDKQVVWCKRMLECLNEYLTWQNLDMAWDDFQQKHPGAPQ